MSARVNAVARAAMGHAWTGELYSNEIEALQRRGYNVNVIQRSGGAFLVTVWK